MIFIFIFRSIFRIKKDFIRDSKIKAVSSKIVKVSYFYNIFIKISKRESVPEGYLVYSVKSCEDLAQGQYARRLHRKGDFTWTHQRV